MCLKGREARLRSRTQRYSKAEYASCGIVLIREQQLRESLKAGEWCTEWTTLLFCLVCMAGQDTVGLPDAPARVEVLIGFFPVYVRLKAKV